MRLPFIGAGIDASDRERRPRASSIGYMNSLFAGYNTSGTPWPSSRISSFWPFSMYTLSTNLPSNQSLARPYRQNRLSKTQTMVRRTKSQKRKSAVRSRRGNNPSSVRGPSSQGLTWSAKDNPPAVCGTSKREWCDDRWFSGSMSICQRVYILGWIGLSESGDASIEWEKPTPSMAISGTDLLEVPIPYIFGLFFRPIFFFWGNISTKYGQKYGTFTYIHFRILKFPLNLAEKWWFDDFSGDSVGFNGNWWDLSLLLEAKGSMSIYWNHGISFSFQKWT